MIEMIAKIVILLFFAFLTYDAFNKSGKHKKEMTDPKFNKYVSELLSKREFRKGMVYSLITLIAFASLFFKTGIEKIVIK